MKKIHILCIGIFLLCITGCSEEESIPQELKVIETHADFDCFGGTGTIQFTSSSPATITSNEDWCKVSLAGNIVTLEVEPNLSINSRTAIVYLKTETQETFVPISQLGDILYHDFQNINFSGEGGEMTFHVKSNHNVIFENVDTSWITITQEEDAVTVKATPLTRGLRENTILIKAGEHQITITFKQVNITGLYDCFINGGTTNYGTCTIEPTEKENVYRVTPEGSAFDAPYNIIYNNGKLSIPFGQYLGKYEGNQPYVYLCSYDKVGRLGWNSNSSYEAEFRLENDKAVLTFKDNGSWSGQHIDGFYYGLFSNLLENGGTTTGAGIAAIVDLVWISK